MLNWFEKWMMRGIATKLARQGNQNEGMEEYYSYIMVAANKVYTEENDESTLSFLEDRHRTESNKHFEFAQRETEC